MKKLLLKMCGVIIFMGLFYFVGLLCLGFFAPPYLRKNLIFPIGGYGHLNSRMQDVKNVNNVDILFLGSSHAYREFDTRIFKAQGYKSFNLGSSGQTPLQTVVLLKRYLHSLHPKLVVYEVYPATFTFDGVEAAIDLIANDRVGWDTYKMAFSLNDILTYNTLLYASLCQLLEYTRILRKLKM
ncbi:MAG: hypothetical protein IPP71_04090 [Bacteroidetes bacterium]|nr:hypothetical protein [Bacteroidota bacterium]